MHKTVRILKDGTSIQDHTYKAGEYANVAEEYIPNLVARGEVEDPSAPPKPKAQPALGTDAVNTQPPERAKKREDAPPISADGSRAGTQPGDPIAPGGETVGQASPHTAANRTDGGHEYTKDDKGPTGLTPTPNPPLKETDMRKEPIDQQQAAQPGGQDKRRGSTPGVTVQEK